MESLVRFQLEYGAELWGFDVWREGEQIQYNMGRRILRCSSMTSKAAIQGDLGFLLLRTRRDLKKLLYWMKIILMDNNRLVKIMYIYSKQQCIKFKKVNWVSSLKKIVIKYNIKYLWDDETKLFNLDNKGNNESKNDKDHFTFWKNWIKKKLFLYEEIKWKVEVEKKPKLRTYKKLKTNLKLEMYLSTNNWKGRMYITNLRSGTNCLEIEQGRWRHLKEEDRLCKYCKLNQVESELHFLTQCTLYERKILFHNFGHILITNGI